MKTLIVLAFRILEGIGMIPVVLIALLGAVIVTLFVVVLIPVVMLSAIILTPIVHFEKRLGIEPGVDIKWSDD